MADKITSAIKKMLGKNEKAAGKAKKKKGIPIEGPGRAISDSLVTDEEAIEREMKRRKSFQVGPGAKTLPKPAPKKKKVKS